MVWDILLEAAASLIIGAAVGYGFAVIVEALSRNFANLWEDFVAIAQSLFSYVSEATKYFFATLIQSLENNWVEIESYLRQEFGYRRNWLVGIFREG
jgi:flagellar biosynthesis protein FliR